MRVVSVPASSRRQHAQLGGVEAVALVPGADQVGEQVVGQVVPAARHHLVDVVVELAPRAHHDRLDLAQVDGEAERLEHVVGPRREPPPVLARRAEQRADDRHGVGAGDVGDDVAATRRGYPVDQLVHHGGHGVVQAGDSARGERLGAQAAQSMVRVALQAQQAVGDLVPQRARVDALGQQIDARRNLEPRIPQHGPDQVIGEHLRAVRPDRHGGPPLRLAQPRIDLRRCLVGVIVQRRQVGVENAWRSGTDGHRGLLIDPAARCGRLSVNVWPGRGSVNDRRRRRHETPYTRRKMHGRDWAGMGWDGPGSAGMGRGGEFTRAGEAAPSASSTSRPARRRRSATAGNR